MLVRLITTWIVFIFLNGISTNTYANESWETLKEGLEFASFKAGDTSHINILRIDPKNWQFSIRATSEVENQKAMSAREWAAQYGFTAAINAGMFHLDYKKHVGYLKLDTHINSKKINGYKSVAAFSPYNGKAPFFQIMDTDDHKNSVENLMQHYRYVVQNLRLIKYPAINRWQPQKKEWNEAALGLDKQGHILFIYSPTPYNMHDFNQLLLSFNIDLVQAQHLEGGLQAQMFIDTQQLDMQNLDQATQQLIEQHNQQLAWKVPFVIGIEPR